MATYGHHLEIKQEHKEFKPSLVRLDGIDLAAKTLHLHCYADDLTTVELELYIGSLDIDMQASMITKGA